jgi:hypothetical protein
VQQEVLARQQDIAAGRLQPFRAVAAEVRDNEGRTVIAKGSQLSRRADPADELAGRGRAGADRALSGTPVGGFGNRMPFFVSDRPMPVFGKASVLFRCQKGRSFADNGGICR